MSRRADAALLLNAILWGTTFVLVKRALQDISPMLFLALRFSLAAGAVLLMVSGRLRAVFSWRAAAAGALSGAFLFAGFAFQTFGLRLTSPPKSAFLTGMTSVMVPLLAALVYKSRPQIAEVAGVIVAVAGLWLLTLQGGIGTIAPGDLLTLLGAVAFAAHIVTLGHFSESMRFEVLVVAQIVAAAALGVVLAGAAEPAHAVWRPAVVWAVLVTGLLCTALAFVLQTWAMQYTSATRTALIYMLEPVVAWITSYWLAGEGLSGRAGAGAALILLGVVLVEMKPSRLRPHPSN